MTAAGTSQPVPATYARKQSEPALTIGDPS